VHVESAHWKETIIRLGYFMGRDVGNSDKLRPNASRGQH